MSRSRVFNLANFNQFTAINVLSDPGHLGGPVIIPNCIKLMLVWTLPNGKLVRNVLGASVGGSFAATPAVAESARLAIVGGGTWPPLAAFMPTTGSFTRVELLDVRTPNQPVVSSTGAATPGTSASAGLPGEVAAVLTLRTALTGTSNRGRVYVPNFATNALGAGDVIAAAAVTAIQGWVANIQGAVANVSGTWVILHPARAAYIGATGTTHPARPAGSVTVTSAIVRDNHWDSQRRRGLK